MKAIFALTFSFTTLAAYSQISLTAGDFAQIGDKSWYFSDTASYYGPGASGALAQWNFSQAQRSDSSRVEVISPAGVSGAAMFPGANQVYSEDMMSFAFYKLDNTGLTALGMSADIPGFEPSVYHPGHMELDFPFTYQDQTLASYTSEFAFSGADLGIYRIVVRSTNTVSIEADGYGTLATPAGTCEALRLKRVQNSVDSMFMQLAPGSPLIYADETYTSGYEAYIWYGKNGKFPLAIYEPSYDISTPGLFQYYVTDGNTMALPQETPAADKSLSIWPNPLTNGQALNVHFNGQNNYNLQLIDLSGKTLWQTQAKNSSQQVSLPALKPGMYILKATGTNVEHTQSTRLILR